MTSILLVVDIHALGAVHGVHFLHDVHLCGARTEDAQDLLRVDGAFDELGAGFDMVAVLTSIGARRVTG